MVSGVALVVGMVIMIDHAYSDPDRQLVTAARLDVITEVLQDFQLDVGRFPTMEEGLAALKHKPEGAAEWNGPYHAVDVRFVDSWGYQLIYLLTEVDGLVVPCVYSVGRNGRDEKRGGDDISSNYCGSVSQD